jgi:large subunit ribosomal protein L16
VVLLRLRHWVYREKRRSLMLQPKKTKYKKQHKGKIGGVKFQALSFGTYGIQCLCAYRLTAVTIEAVRRAIARSLQRQGKIWVRVFPDVPVSKKPAEVRIGKGKGAVNHWVCRIQKGQILFEVAGVTEKSARQAIRLANQKLPFATLFVVSER